MIKGKTAAILAIAALACSVSITGCNGKSDKAVTENTVSSEPTQSTQPEELTISEEPEASASAEAVPSEDADTSSTSSAAASDKDGDSSSTDNSDPEETEQSTKTESPFELEEELKGTYLGAFSSSDQPKLQIYIVGTDLVLYDNDLVKLQTLNVKTDMDDSTFAENAVSMFMYEDCNFDTYLDIAVVSSIDGDDTTYNYFIWDQDSQSYKYNKVLSKVKNVKIVENKNLINSRVYSDENTYTDYTYDWANDHSLCYKSKAIKVTYNTETKKYKITTKEYDTDGKETSSDSKTSKNPF